MPIYTPEILPEIAAPKQAMDSHECELCSHGSELFKEGLPTLLFL